MYVQVEREGEGKFSVALHVDFVLWAFTISNY